MKNKGVQRVWVTLGWVSVEIKFSLFPHNAVSAILNSVTIGRGGSRTWTCSVDDGREWKDQSDRERTEREIGNQWVRWRNACEDGEGFGGQPHNQTISSF